ncbi:MAG: hypothetical protein R2875_13240 [Desulfobacterales bacterium]
MNSNDAFYFNRLPVSTEAIHAYTQEFFPPQKIKGHYIKRLFVGICIFLLRIMPHWLAYLVGTGIGKILYYARLRHHIAATNLDIVYGDTKSASEKQAIYKASLANFGRVIINYMRLPFAGEKFWTRHCELINEDILIKAANRKKGVIFVGGHIGMWDLAGGKVGMSGYPTAVVSKGVDDPVIDKLVTDARMAMNMGGIDVRNTMDRIFEGLQRGESIVLALDQNMKKEQGRVSGLDGEKSLLRKIHSLYCEKIPGRGYSGYMIQLGPKRFQLILKPELPGSTVRKTRKKGALNNQNRRMRAENHPGKSVPLALDLQTMESGSDGSRKPLQVNGLGW